MNTKMSEKQAKASACLDELIKYAAANRVPMRIMDELEDCKKQISSKNVDWTAVNMTMEGLLSSIEQKVVPQTVQKESNNHEVSVEMVKEQVEKMAKRCRADNESSVDNMAERKNMIVRKIYEQLTDLSRTKAHLGEFKDEGLYLQFFQKCRIGYEEDSFEMFREFLQSVSENYNHMMNHMKNMIQSIGGYKIGIGSEKFYYEYEERRNGIDQRIQAQMQTADIGGDDIMSLGQSTKQTVKNIIKKSIRKKRFLAWLPFLILLGFLAAGSVGKMAEKRSEAEQIEAEQIETDAESEDSFLEDAAKEAAKSSVKKLADQITWKALRSALISFSAVLILIVMILVLLYLLYLKMIRAWCDRQICRQCGEYLGTELHQFGQKNELSAKLDTAMKNAVEEYEYQYMNVLNTIFQTSQDQSSNTQTGKASEFDSLRAEWNHAIDM